MLSRPTTNGPLKFKLSLHYLRRQLMCNAFHKDFFKSRYTAENLVLVGSGVDHNELCDAGDSLQLGECFIVHAYIVSSRDVNSHLLIVSIWPNISPSPSEWTVASTKQSVHKAICAVHKRESVDAKVFGNVESTSRLAVLDRHC